MARNRRILVPVDFSEHSGKALEYALDLAARFNSHLEVLHVLSPPLVVRPEFAIYATDGTSLSTLQAEVTHQVERFVAAHAGPHAKQLETHVVQGVAYDAIVRVARDHAIDLIVMGTHGRSGLAHFFVGSVAEKVVRHAHCPVLTIREVDGSTEQKA